MTRKPASISSVESTSGVRLNREFYTQPTIDAARHMLGKWIVHACENGEMLGGKILEVEVYKGVDDKASHAFGGKITPRNRAEWMQGGYVYIYLVYGMYWQLNISTYREGTPECVLIRAIMPEISNTQNHKKILKMANGPGKVCRYLRLDKNFYGEDLTTSEWIWLEDREEKILPKDVAAAPRIGIDYAGPYWARRKWRFLLREYEPYLAKWKSAYASSNS